MKLLAYKYENGDVLGIDVKKFKPNTFDDWTDDTEFIAVAPFLIVEDDYFIYPYYEDISSITAWGQWGQQYRKQWDDEYLTWVQVRKEIRRLMDIKIAAGQPFTSEEDRTIELFKLDNYFKVYDLLEKFEDPTVLPADYDYNILGLKKKRSWTKGELKKIELHKNFDPQTQQYSDLYVEELREISRVGGFAAIRTQTTRWYRTDGTYEESVDYKGYTLAEAIQEGVSRRNNIISQLKIDVIGLIAMAEGLTALSAEEPAKMILRGIQQELSLYIDGDPLPLINKFKSVRSSRLDYFVPGTGDTMTIRDYILNAIIF